ncbi:acyl carrier protein [Dactylosporangium aurantiacum]|uniref:Acyl carrier protein n=1 Tax=Dactylosporangium aurantiacum TaxID=35754 RepID=A0A9Q9ISB9_9ACTN|nr:acyl carrier protein [Dactylosporangium aurantiacum]MDG6103898.1 acyl carrier protein [Dactylosporangium aurantiacum]UWZ58912.1 acyl carrier protein [Dactylosporangium aurantiacum]
MATPDPITGTLIGFLSDIKGRDVAPDLAADDNALRALNLDSLETVELSVRLEKDLGVEFGKDPADLAALESLHGLTALVRDRLPA